MSLWKRLVRGGDEIDGYFLDAVFLYAALSDPIVRAAALSAGKIAAGAQRAWMVTALRAIAAEAGAKIDQDVVEEGLR